MLDVTEATKNAYKNYGSSKELYIRIGGGNNPIVLRNSDIIGQSLSLTERLETSENLTFTGCNSTVLQFKCKDISANIKNSKIYCYIVANNTEEVPLFTGTIDTVNNTSHEQMTMDIVAYDALYLLRDLDMKNWYETLSFPMTLKQFRDALFVYLNSYYSLQQEEDTLPNDDMTIYKAIDSENIACLDLLRWICQINGRYGRIDRYGKFDYMNIKDGLYPAINLYPSTSLYPGVSTGGNVIDKSYYSTVDFENFKVKKIGKVNLRDKNDNVIAFAGANANIWNINTNPYIWGYPEGNQSALNTIASNLYNAVKDIEYTPLNSLSLAGLPYIEVGDCITIEAKRSTVTTYILERTLTGTNALKDSYTAKSIEAYPIYKPNPQKQTEILDNKVDEVKEDIEKLYQDKQNIIPLDILQPTWDANDSDLTFFDNPETGQREVWRYTTDHWEKCNLDNRISFVYTEDDDIIPGQSQLATGHIIFVYE